MALEKKMGVATRDAYGKTLLELGKQNLDIVVLDGDLSKSTQQPIDQQPIDDEQTYDNLKNIKKPLDTSSQFSSFNSKLMGDAPACSECGHITVRNGNCYRCLNCGASMGCS